MIIKWFLIDGCSRKRERLYYVNILRDKHFDIETNIECISRENIMCSLVLGLWCSDRCVEYRLAQENVPAIRASFVKAHL